MPLPQSPPGLTDTIVLEPGQASDCLALVRTAVNNSTSRFTWPNQQSVEELRHHSPGSQTAASLTTAKGAAMAHEPT